MNGIEQYSLLEYPSPFMYRSGHSSNAAIINPRDSLPLFPKAFLESGLGKIDGNNPPYPQITIGIDNKRENQFFPSWTIRSCTNVVYYRGNIAVVAQLVEHAHGYRIAHGKRNLSANPE